MEPRDLYRFGPFELDPAAGELRRGGLALRIPRQPLRILSLLVSRSGEVVTREELHDAIWGSERFVDFEHGINSAIRQIRFALGDQAETPRYVRTLPRRGYSFIATVERVARPGEVEPEVISAPVVVAKKSESRVPAIAASLLIAVTVMVALIAHSKRVTDAPSGRTVSVQPFRRLGPAIAGLDERPFAEELRAVVGRLPRAHVSLVGAGAASDLVINGTIRKYDDGVRVIVTVADAATQTQLFSETFRRPADSVDGLTVQVAHRVTRELARRLIPPARYEPQLRTRASSESIALYRHARLLHTRSQAYDWMRTKEQYEAALKVEPRLAEAWSGLGDVWGIQMLSGPLAERRTAAAHAENCAQRALALQPSNPEAHSTLGLIAAQWNFDLAAAEDAMRRATIADAGYVDARLNLAMILAMRGQADESLRELAHAQQLDPVNLGQTIVEPLLYLHARRYEDAAARYRDILAVNPQSNQATWGLMYALIAQRNWGDALALARTLPRAQVAGNVPATEAGFNRVFRGLEDYMQYGRGRGWFNDYFLSLYYAQTGDRERAFALLEQAVEQRIPHLSYIMVDPRLESLRGDPRFNALVSRLRLGRPPERPPLVAAAGR